MVVKAADVETPKSVQVENMEVGTAIDNKELAGSAKEFDASVTRVYCWTKITAATPPVTVKHVWYADDKKEAEIPARD